MKYFIIRCHDKAIVCETDEKPELDDIQEYANTHGVEVSVIKGEYTGNYAEPEAGREDVLQVALNKIEHVVSEVQPDLTLATILDIIEGTKP